MMKCAECSHCKAEEAERKRQEAERQKRQCKEPSFSWRRFQFSDYWANSDKFWQIKMDIHEPTTVWLQYGRRGTVGTKIKKEFTWTYEARKYFTSKVNEKLAEGYTYVGTR